VELSERLWNEATPLYADDPAARRTAVLEQYKLYVEMADRVSQRRGLVNTFFLTLNTAVLTVVGVFWQKAPPGDPWWLVFPLLAIVGECAAWYSLLRSYRLLNAAKFRVIGALEERLPASPYWRAEWWALGEGKDRRRYWPLSHAEQWVPVLFVLVYLAGFVSLLLS
jgi:hypothetical protein